MRGPFRLRVTPSKRVTQGDGTKAILTDPEVPCLLPRMVLAGDLKTRNYAA